MYKKMKVLVSLIAMMSYLVSGGANYSVSANITEESLATNIVSEPMMIQDIFLDSALAQAIAERLGKIVSDTVTQTDLDDIVDLVVPDKQIESLSGIEYLRALTYLDISNNFIQNIDVIWELRVLRELIATNNRIAFVSNKFPAAYTELTYVLRHLNLGGNQLTDITFLQHFMQLDHLDLSSNNITNIQPLSMLHNLNNIHLENNSISDLGPLADIRNPELVLDVAKNQVSDVTPLANLGVIRSLNLSYNQIQDISALFPLLKANAEAGKIDQIDLNQQEIQQADQLYDEHITLVNQVTDHMKKLVAPQHINHSGIYSEPNIHWELSEYQNELNYEFNLIITASELGPDNGDLSTIFSGRVIQKLQAPQGQYLLTYDINGGEGVAPEVQSVRAGEHLLIPDEPSKPNHNFTGWNTAKDGSGQSWDFEHDRMPASDLTLYAQFFAVYKTTFMNGYWQEDGLVLNAKAGVEADSLESGLLTEKRVVLVQNNEVVVGSDIVLTDWYTSGKLNSYQVFIANEKLLQLQPGEFHIALEYYLQGEYKMLPLRESKPIDGESELPMMSFAQIGAQIVGDHPVIPQVIQAKASLQVTPKEKTAVVKLASYGGEQGIVFDGYLKNTVFDFGKEHRKQLVIKNDKGEVVETLPWIATWDLSRWDLEQQEGHDLSGFQVILPPHLSVAGYTHTVQVVQYDRVVVETVLSLY